MILYSSHVSGSLSVKDNVIVGNALYAREKHFLIDHPLYKNKKLIYSALEGPENAVYYRGKLYNENIINLPEYWKNLIDENTITVQLMPIGKFQKLYISKIENNKIYIKKAFFNFNKINCYFLVIAERKDISKLKTEVELNYVNSIIE